MNVTKIKIKQDRVFVEYDKIVIVDEKELLNKYSIDSPEQPVQAFKDAFQALDWHLIELCELADKADEVAIMCEDVTITGLSLKYDEGALNGAIITGTKQLAYSNSPLILNTPNKSIIAGEDGYDRMKHLTNTCVAALVKVIDFAERYVSGERLQIEIPLKDSVGIHDSVKATVTQNEEVLEDKPEDFSKDDVKRETVESEDLQVPETSDIDEEILD